MTDTLSIPPLNFLAAGGEMGALMRAFDGSTTSLGPPDTWPQSLRTTVGLLLTSNHPMFIWWGPELARAASSWCACCGSSGNIHD